MSITASGWKNKGGTGERSCKCGSWKNHWVDSSGKSWPTQCSVLGCNNSATLGAHVFNIDRGVCGEYIIPACNSCNSLSSEFNLKGSITLVPANQQKTCKQK